MRMRRILRRLCAFVLVWTMLMTVGFYLFRRRYAATIRSLSRTQVINTTSDLINDAINSQIETGNIQYDRLIYFEKDLDGKITALKTNMSEVNRLKTQILDRINEQILAIDASALSIPIGSLILPELFSGKGFGIPVEILYIRNSDGAFYSHFSEAGINQTLQQLTMEVSVDVAVLVLGKTDSFTVTGQVVVAETVIVGQVPATYLQTGGKP